MKSKYDRIELWKRKVAENKARKASTMNSKQRSNVIRTIGHRYEYDRGRAMDARNAGRISEQQLNDRIRNLQAEKFFEIERLRG